MDQTVVFDDTQIVDIVPIDQSPAVPCIADAPIVTPGFVDLQINGGGGILFNDEPTIDTISTMGKAARNGGTCWFFPTFITDYHRSYTRAIAAASDPNAASFGALGVHLEGPFLSKARPGIHPADAIRTMDQEDEKLLTDADIPMLLTVSPEEVGTDRIERLAEAGLSVFAGHTEASFETMVRAEKSGLTGVTHLYNAMSQLQGRTPGVVGATLASQKLHAGIIADGFHVHAANLRIAFDALGPSRLFLVTDAMSPLGTDMTGFTLFGRAITRKTGRLTDEDGTLAGADISMIECLRNAMAMTGCTLSQAVQMATLTPAQAVGLDSSIGSVLPGKKPALTLLDEDMTVQAIVFDGKLTEPTLQR